MQRRPGLILVTGPAGSGKTTLAHRLAAAVGCPAICRDEIKEGMVATAGPRFVPATSDPLTMRTYDVFFATLQLLLRAEVTLVAEAAFQHRIWMQGLEPILPLVDLRIVRCSVADRLALERLGYRRTTLLSRRAHDDTGPVTAPSDFVPIDLEVPTLDVDTAGGYVPALAEIVAFVR